MKTLDERLRRFKRRIVSRALRMTGGCVRAAAEMLGRDRSTVYDLIRSVELDIRDFQPGRRSNRRKKYFGVDVAP